jgi:hypothetical protein
VRAIVLGTPGLGTPWPGPSLTGPSLTGLTGADLTGADLTGADLTGADLTGADLPKREPLELQVPELQLPGLQHSGLQLSGASTCPGRRMWRTSGASGRSVVVGVGVPGGGRGPGWSASVGSVPGSRPTERQRRSQVGGGCIQRGRAKLQRKRAR